MWKSCQNGRIYKEYSFMEWAPVQLPIRTTFLAKIDSNCSKVFKRVLRYLLNQRGCSYNLNYIYADNFYSWEGALV